jgi:hypothetical protein
VNVRALRLSTAAAMIALASCQASCLAGSRASTTGRNSTTSIGRATVDVYGHLRGIVLVDPLGRRDELTDSTLVTDIPGCSRWPGGIEHELDNPDTSYKDEMLFQLEQCLPGQYEVHAIADDSVDVRINVVLEPVSGTDAGCPSVERVDRVPHGRVSWTLETRGSPPKGECNVMILPAVLGKRNGPR